MDEKERFRFDAQITSPPSWEDPDQITPEQADADAAAWAEAASAGGKGVRV